MKHSIIIHVYNEAKRIAKNIDAIFAFFSPYSKSLEVIFVNDGSCDGTEEILKRFQKIYDFKILGYNKNRGKGYAVRRGVLASRGDWVVFFDIDLAVPLTEFEHLLSFQALDDQVIIGSRRLRDSRIGRSESFIRTFLGQGFSFLSNFFVPEVPDFTCGFKCFSQNAAQKIFSRARVSRWAFDTEIIYIAKLQKIPIRQMSIFWTHDNDSRVRVIKDIATSVKELVEIKLNQLRGFYD